MLREEALTALSNKTVSIEIVEHIITQFINDTHIENAVAINLDLRTSVYNSQQEKSDVIVRILGILSHSSEMSVRWAVAKNPHTPATILSDLSQDPINLVRALVATNKTTPKSILQKLFNDEKIVRDGLSGNPSTPLKLLRVLADDADAMVRLRVVENPSATPEIWEYLSQDHAENVRKAAHLKLKKVNV